MLRRILVPLENSLYTDAIIKYACFVAEQQNAEVVGGIFLDIPKHESHLGHIDGEELNWSLNVDHKIKEEAENTVIYLKNKFAKACKQKNLKYSFYKYFGLPSSKIAEKARYFDLVITGLKSDFRLYKKGHTSEFLKSILNESVTPVLAVPRTFKPVKNVFIAYDGNNAASRALQRFAHISNLEGHNIKIFMSSEDIEGAKDTLDEVKDYLLTYGARKISLEWTASKITSTFEKDFYEFQPDLVVLGLHSRKFLVDFFIGSVTEFLIEMDRFPLFIGI